MPDGSLLTIEWVTKWGAGLKTIYLAKGIASLRLAPGNYTIRLEEKNWPQLYKVQGENHEATRRTRRLLHS